MPTKRTGRANLNVARVLVDAGIECDPQELAIMLTRAIRAESIGDMDSYQNQVQSISMLIRKGFK